jgi:spore coat protein U-like protein
MLVGTAGLSATSYAATATDNMAVSTLVTISCSMTAGEMQFATYDPSSGNPGLGTATITSNCTAGGAAVITLDQGANAATTSTDAVPLRRMIGAGGNLNYDLYSESTRTTIFGNTVATGKAFTATSGDNITTVFGRIIEEQEVGAGSFADSVAVTLTY